MVQSSLEEHVGYIAAEIKVMDYDRDQEDFLSSQTDTASDSETEYECSSADEIEDVDSDKKIYSEIVKDLNSEIIRNQIDKSLLLGQFAFEDGTATLEDDTNFNLLYRRSKREIIIDTALKLKEAQTLYKQNVNDAYEFFTSNISSSFLMDAAFVDVENDMCNKMNNTMVRQLTDGTLQLNCPLRDCSVSTCRLKRHLQLKHSHLNEKKIDFCIMMARKMERNKLASEKCSVTEDSSNSKKKQRRHKPLEHVTKRDNYVKCNLCTLLVTNHSQHLRFKHKLAIDSDVYISSLKLSEVFPRVYTKSEGNFVTELKGSELCAAKKQYGNKIEEELLVLTELKKSRNEIEELKRRIQGSSSQKQKNGLRKKLNETTENYKKYRYRDTRTYSGRTKVWKDAFEMYLKLRDNYNPKRCSTMAIDIVLKYEKCNGHLSFTDLKKTSNIRKMVQLFKNSEGMKASSKMKYLKMFSNLLKFLLLDCDSPEKSDEEAFPDKLSRSVLCDEGTHEVDNAIASLAKQTSVENLESREETTKKLISKEELVEISNSVRNDLLKVLAMSSSDRALLSPADAISVRNNLIAIATINLGRRSMEMTTMTLKEVAEAEETILHNGEMYFVIQVPHQKCMKSGKKGAVAFKKDEFEVLKIFINELRQKICTNQQLQCVFPSTI